MQVELHQLDRKYERLKVRDGKEEARLVAALAESRQQTPVVVVAGPDPVRPYVLIDGYKRVRAAVRAGVDVLEATVWEQRETEALVLVHTLQRPRARNGLEDGHLVELLVAEEGLSLAAAGARLGRSESWASRRLGLVRELPEWLRRSIINGNVACYAATKYLVPLARANRDHAERLAQRLGDLRASTRDVGVLYLAWKTGDEMQRELVVTRPEVVLAAHRARCGDDGPEAAVLDELASAEARLHQARRGLDRLALMGLEDWCRERLRRRFGRVAGALCAVEKTLEEILNETLGSGDAPADSAIACAAGGDPADCPPGGLLAAGGGGRDPERERAAQDGGQAQPAGPPPG